MEISSGTTINLNSLWEKDVKLERDCNALSHLFSSIVSDLRNSYPIWEEFSCRTVRFANSIKNTQIAMNSFLESFQKIADVASHTKGATKDIGSALTRLQLRHKNIENRLKSLSTCLVEKVSEPIVCRIEDWKKSINQLDKDHAKDGKRVRIDVKKASSDTIRAKKKAKKSTRSQELTRIIEKAASDEYSKKVGWEEMEKNYVRKAMIEERQRFCTLVDYLHPVLDCEMDLFSDVNQLQEVIENLNLQTHDPFTLPLSSEQIIMDLKDSLSRQTGSTCNLKRSPPSSPSSLGSRKSSVCSINSIALSSSSSQDSINSSTNQSLSSYQPPPLNIPIGGQSRSNRNSIVLSMTGSDNLSDMITDDGGSDNQQPLYATIRRNSKSIGVARLSSISSHDSGFISQDTLFPRPTTPKIPNDLTYGSISGNKGNCGDNTGGNSSSSSLSAKNNENDSQSTWTNWPEQPQTSSHNNNDIMDRPHTISASYEKNHSRPAITAQTYEIPNAAVLPAGSKSTSVIDSNNDNLPPPPLPFRPPSGLGFKRQQQPHQQQINDDNKTPTEDDFIGDSTEDSLAMAIKQLEDSTAQLQASENIRNRKDKQQQAGEERAGKGKSTIPKSPNKKPPPPIRRSSTITMADINLPLPPAPLSTEEFCNKLDDLPPPPPELLMPPPPAPNVKQYHNKFEEEIYHRQQQQQQSNHHHHHHQNNKVVRRHHSLSNTHASVIEALNFKLKTPNKIPMTTLHTATNTTANHHGHHHPTSLALRSNSYDANADIDNEITPTQDRQSTVLQQQQHIDRIIKLNKHF